MGVEVFKDTLLVANSFNNMVDICSVVGACGLAPNDAIPTKDRRNAPRDYQTKKPGCKSKHSNFEQKKSKFLAKYRNRFHL